MESEDLVLYIDDELINLELFELNFSDRFNVVLAESGQRGLEQLEKNTNIKAVITDYKMPEMNGMEFILKAKSLYPNIKFSILTGYDIFEEIRMAIANGLIEYYFSKPFSYDKLEQAILRMYNR